MLGAELPLTPRRSGSQRFALAAWYSGNTFGTRACSSAIRFPGEGCVLRNSDELLFSAAIIFCHTFTAARGS